MRKLALALFVIAACSGKEEALRVVVSIARDAAVSPGRVAEAFEQIEAGVAALPEPAVAVESDSTISALRSARGLVDGDSADFVVLVSLSGDSGEVGIAVVGPTPPFAMGVGRPDPPGYLIAPAWPQAIRFIATDSVGMRAAQAVYGFVLASRGDETGALAAWMRADARGTAVHRANLLLGRLDPPYDEIAALCDSATTHDSGCALVAQGALRLCEGDRASARVLFLRAARDDDASRAAVNNAIVIDLEAGLTADGMRSLDSLVATDSMLLAARLNRSWLDLASGSARAAVEGFENLHARFPDEPVVLARLAMSRFAVGNEGLASRGRTAPFFRAGRKSLERARYVSHDDVRVLDEVGWALYRNEQPIEAMDVYRDAIEKDSTSCELRSRLGMAYALQARLVQNDPDETAAIFDRADSTFEVASRFGDVDAAARTEWSGSLYELGELLAERELYAAAETKFRRAFDLNPADDRAAYGVARALVRQSRDGAALEWFARSDSLVPEDWKTYLWGIAAYRVGDRERADRLFERGERYADYSAECSAARARIARDLGRLDSTLVSKARRAYPDTARFVLCLAMVADDMNHIEDALRLYSDAIALDPTQEVAHYAYARLLEETGRVDEARAEYRAFLRHSRGEFPAKERIARERARG